MNNFVVSTSIPSGGKAGKYRNLTASIQVRHYIRPREFFLKASFPFSLASTSSKALALAKAKKWIADNS